MALLDLSRPAQLPPQAETPSTVTEYVPDSSAPTFSPNVKIQAAPTAPAAQTAPPATIFSYAAIPTSSTSAILATRTLPSSPVHYTEQMWKHSGTCRYLVPPGSVLQVSASYGQTSHAVFGFDLDSTIITTKSGRVRSPADQYDWRFLYENVPKKLQSLWMEGYRLVIFTNQSGQPDVVQRKVCDILNTLGVPVEVYIATDHDLFRKPATGMWDLMCRQGQGAVDIAASRFCGDAAGRQALPSRNLNKDFSDSDRAFAYNVGLAHSAELAFLTPENLFTGQRDPRTWQWSGPDPQNILDQCRQVAWTLPPLPAQQELVVLVGPPAAGKSTLSEQLAEAGYERINRDTLKTQAKCLQATREALAQGPGGSLAGRKVVIDNTNPDPAARQAYIELARQRSLPVRCYWLQTDVAVARHMNEYRAKTGSAHVPGIAFNIYNSHFSPPSLSEGFTEIVKVPLKLKLSASQEKIFLQRTSTH